MNKKTMPQPTETNSESPEVAFENLPEETKELMKLKEGETKTSGPEHAAVTRKIQDKSRESEP